MRSAVGMSRRFFASDRCARLCKCAGAWRTARPSRAPVRMDVAVLASRFRDVDRGDFSAARNDVQLRLPPVLTACVQQMPRQVASMALCRCGIRQLASEPVGNDLVCEHDVKVVPRHWSLRLLTAAPEEPVWLLDSLISVIAPPAGNVSPQDPRGQRSRERN